MCVISVTKTLMYLEHSNNKFRSIHDTESLITLIITTTYVYINNYKQIGWIIVGYLILYKIKIRNNKKKEKKNNLPIYVTTNRERERDRNLNNNSLFICLH